MVLIDAVHVASLSMHVEALTRSSSLASISIYLRRPQTYGSWMSYADSCLLNTTSFKTNYRDNCFEYGYKGWYLKCNVQVYDMQMLQTILKITIVCP